MSAATMSLLSIVNGSCQLLTSVTLPNIYAILEFSRVNVTIEASGSSHVCHLLQHIEEQVSLTTHVYYSIEVLFSLLEVLV